MSGKTFSEATLISAEKRFGFSFPPDVFEVLQSTPIPGGYDWEIGDAKIRFALAGPLEGLLFDVEFNGLWWPEWGERPDDERSRKAVVVDVVKAAPTLIPLFGHRYVPASPNECANPIFSVVQSDIIIYGSDVQDWLYQEFQISLPRNTEPREIQFWTTAVKRNGDADYFPFRPD